MSARIQSRLPKGALEIMPTGKRMVSAAERIDRILQRTNGNPSEYNDKEKIVENIDAILDDVFSIAWAMGLRIKRDHIIEACGLSAGNENVRITGLIMKNKGGRPKNTTIEGVKTAQNA